MSQSPCQECLARRWLIGELSPLLDYQRARPERLIDLLSLPCSELIEAVAGRRREELRAGLAQPRPSHGPSAGTLEVCRHSRHYPRRALPLPQAPLLSFRGEPEPIARLQAAPAVAFVGSRAPSGYGVQMAGGLARAVASAGVCVVAGMDSTIGRSALAGALRAGAGALAVMQHGLAVPLGGATRQLTERLAAQGCLVSEQPHRARGRSWGALAAERLTVAMSDLVLVVEARADTSEMLGAQLAGTLGRPLGALPGMLTNPLASGPHALLSAGAALVRGPEDLLDILHLDASAPPAPPAPPARPARPLRRELASLLEEVGAGSDTVESLSRGGRSTAFVLAALGELEALGLIVGLPGGRYQATQPAAPRPRRGGAGRSGESAW